MAIHYAMDTASDAWDFSIPIQRLVELGATETDLRWMVRKGYVAHMREVTVEGDARRQFCSSQNMRFSRDTCFVLTEKGMASECLPENATKDFGSPFPAQPHPLFEDNRNKKPHWDRCVRKLNINGSLVKHFRWPAENQEAVLNAFQEEDWPEKIYDPLPPKPEQSSKRRLADTIKCLNRKQTNKLLEFHGDGTGEAIVWRCTEVIKDEGYPFRAHPRA